MDIEAEIARLHNSSKTFSSPPSWHYDGREQEKWVMSVPLEIDYVTVEGLYLDGWCFTNAPESSVTFSLLYRPATGLSGPIARLDWRPVHSHKNGGRVAGDWKWKSIETTHLHGYDMNRSMGWARMVQNNLPIALPVDEDLRDFRALLGYSGRIWNISDMQRVPVPEWQNRLA